MKVLKEMKAMKTENLTPHEVTILDGEGRVVWTIPASGKVARVAQTTRLVGNAGGIPLVVSRYGEVVGLPAPQPETDEMAETIYIVSAMVRSAVPSRRDVASPADFVRDGAGKIIGCRAMEVNLAAASGAPNAQDYQ